MMNSEYLMEEDINPEIMKYEIPPQTILPESSNSP